MTSAAQVCVNEGNFIQGLIKLRPLPYPDVEPVKLNLDSLRAEIESYLDTHGIVIFHSHPRAADTSAPVYWDTERQPDYKLFLAAAESVGAKLVTIHAREFTEDILEDALDHATSSALPREERRAIELRLKEMRGYLGFTCQIELSFDLAPRVYVFDLRTEWFDDLNDLLDRVDDAAHQKPNGDSPLGGGYFSRN